MKLKFKVQINFTCISIGKSKEFICVSHGQTFLSTLYEVRRWNNGGLASSCNKNGTTDYIVLSCSSYRSNPFPPDFSEITYWNIGTSFRADPVPSMYKVAQETSSFSFSLFSFFFFFLLLRFIFVATTRRSCYCLWQIAPGYRGIVAKTVFRWEAVLILRRLFANESGIYGLDCRVKIFDSRCNSR